MKERSLLGLRSWLHGMTKLKGGNWIRVKWGTSSTRIFLESRLWVGKVSYVSFGKSNATDSELQVRRMGKFL